MFHLHGMKRLLGGSTFNTIRSRGVEADVSGWLVAVFEQLTPTRAK